MNFAIKAACYSVNRRSLMATNTLINALELISVRHCIYYSLWNLYRQTIGQWN